MIKPVEPKKILCIHDLSGVGRCSLAVILPVLSVMGLQPVALPTVVLSTHTGGLGTPARLDGCAYGEAALEHYHALGLDFDCIYTGYLGGEAQVALAEKAFALWPSAHKVVDPVMGDNGTLYGIFNKETAQSMTRLCEKADILTPNMTEAYCLLHEPFKDGPYDEKELKRVMKALSDFGPKIVILTGAYTDEETIGAACYDREKDETALVLSDRVPGKYHGTGDIFAAVMLGAMLNGKTVKEACAAAVRYTAKCIEETRKACGDNTIWGVKFEKCLPFLMHDVLTENDK